jgi:hypothetical protein
MMSSMEPATSSRPTRDYPRTPDGKYKYTAWDGSPRYFEQMILPGLGFGFRPGLIRHLRKHLKRATPKPL